MPVKLKNNWLTRPLNMVTEMYSLPAYGSLDPNPLMAPFFILFYGMMMADMGYGLVMMLASLIVLKKKKPGGTMGHLFGLLGLCGVSTFLFGALTGGFFGDFLTQLFALTGIKTNFALPALFTPPERHHDDPGGGHVPGLCTDHHRHGHQLCEKAENTVRSWTPCGRRSPGGWYSPDWPWPF